MWSASRPPIERLQKLHELIREGDYPNSVRLGQDLRCSPRTIQRDIEYLRDALKAPLAFHRRENGYYYTDPSWTLSLLTLTEGEMVALFLAERVLRQYRGAPFAAELKRAFTRLTSGLDEVVRLDLGYLDGSFSFRTTDDLPMSPETFSALARAIRARERLRLDYFSASRGAASAREVDPYHLACVDGAW